MSTRKGDTIIAIDLLRFACALLVVYYHVDVAWWVSPSPHAAALIVSPVNTGSGNALSRIGWIGVELFFVISGAVITRSALGTDVRAFLRHRLLRLAPAAWICATFTFALLAASGLFKPGLVMEWVRSLLFWPVGEQIDSSYWTLGVETFFYLAVAAAMMAGGRRRIERLAWIIGGVSAGVWLASWRWPGLIAPMADQGVTLLQVPFGCFFAIGMMIGLARERRMRPAHWLFCALLLAGALTEIAAHAGSREAALGVPVSAGFAAALFLVGAAVIAFGERIQAALVRLVSPAVARSIGLMTYPLYLIHQDAGAAIAATLLALGLSAMVAKVLTVATVIALAGMVSAWMEPLLRDVLARLLSPRRGPRPDNRPTASLPTG